MSDNLTAAQRSVAALELGPEHDALVVAVAGLAEAVDGDPSNASMWREYRQALGMLAELADASDDSAFAELRRALEDSGA